MPEATIRFCNHVLSVDSNNCAALAMFAEASRRLDDFEAALPALKRLAELMPRQPGVFQSLGRALAHLQHDSEAIDAFETCLNLDEKKAEAWRGLGNACARAGKTARAIEAMQKAIAINGRDTAAHYQLTTLVRARPDDPRAQTLEELYVGDGFSDRDRSRIAFSVARIRDQQGAYDDAFAWFQKANGLRLKEDELSIEADESWIQRAIDTFSADLFSQHASVAPEPSQAVLIVGMPRSGSTLLEQVLASHPDVHGAGELMLLPDALGGLGEWLGAEDILPQAAAKVSDDAWSTLGKRYASMLSELAPQARRIVDKQLFNYTLVGFARLMLPGARILHTIRHPMATCWSCYATAFRNNHGFTSDLAALGKTWRLYQRIMDHWHTTLPDYLFEVRYENMLDDLESTARNVLEFLGLPWDDKCLEFYKAKRSVTTASKTQVRQPIYKGSRDHWRNYEAHLEPLRAAMQPDQP